MRRRILSWGTVARGGPAGPRAHDARRRLASPGRLAAAAAVLLLGGSGLVTLVVSDPPAARAGTPATPLLTADPQPTWQTNGIVWAIEEAAGVVYVGGNFTSVRPPGATPGQNEVPRKNLAAFDAATGALLPFSHAFTAPTYSYDPAVTRPDVSCTVNWTAHTYTCDTVYQIKKSPDGSKIYVGGDFVWVDGADRRKLAAFPTATAKTANPPLDTAFRPAGTNGRVRAMAVSAGTVYAGGEFTLTGSPAVSRTRLAAFDRLTGALRPWAPTVTLTGAPAPVNGHSFAHSTLLTLALSPDHRRVVLGGNFFQLNGQAIHGLAAVDATSGARTPWAGHFVVPARSYITDLTTDSGTVYAAADGYGTFDGRFATDPATGAVKWVDWCRGATSALAVIGDVLYSGSHAHNCRYDGIVPGGFGEQAPHRWFRLLAESTRDGAPTIQHWFPSTNGGDPTIPAHQTPSRQGVRAMKAVGASLWVGGQFTLVNDRPQQGLTRFVRSAASFAPLRPERPVVASTAPGTVHVSWRATPDYDDETLSYEVYRGTTVVHRVSRAGKPWDEPPMAFTDTGLTPGTSVTYQVRAVDGRGTASPKSYTATTTVAAGTQPYSQAVLADAPSDYWRLDETAGPTLASLAGPPAVAGPGVAYSGPGAVASQPTTRSLYLNGTTASRVYGRELRYAPSQLSVELFFTTRGTGKLVGFGNRQTGDSSTYDRQLYLNALGQLSFGVWRGGAQVVTSPLPYNDGRWHHTVATFGPAGLALYVDGALVASRADAGTAESYHAGFWRIGGDSMTGWPYPGAANVNGYLDEVSIYPRQLSAADVSRHHRAARG